MTLEDIYETLVQQSMIFIREPTPPPIKPIPGQAIRIPKSRKSSSHSVTTLRRSKSNNQLYKAQSRYKSQEAAVNGHDASGRFVAPKHYEIRFDREKVKGYVRNWEGKGYLTLKPEKLQWTPYLLTRSAIEEAKAKERKINGMENSFVNGRHEEGVVMLGEETVESPAPDEDEDELPVPRRTRSSRREGTQTPRRQGLRNEVRMETPTPTGEEGEDDARSVRRRNRTARKEEEEDEVFETKVEVGSGGKKRRRVDSETPSKGCVKYEEAVTPERVFGMEGGRGLPVSDERSTLEMEMGDEDAEGSEEDVDAVYSVVD